jgi:alanine racemase
MIFTWLEISKKALLNNVAQIKKMLPSKTKFMAVVKANAYGHGLFEVVSSIKDEVDYLAVYDFNDAILLREKGVKLPILVLARIFEEQVDLAIKYDFAVTVSTFDILQNVKKPLRVHICADTGLGRDGFVFSELTKVINLLENSPLKIEGLYAHFASSDDKNGFDYTERQIEELLVWKKSFAQIGLKPLVHHAASAGSLFGKIKEDFDIARIGMSLYGIWPSEDVKIAQEKTVKLMPVLSWKAKIVELKNLPKGSKISYNSTYELQRDSKLAVLPIGYFDGISRVSSNKSMVIVGGKKVQQVGRVTMNLIVLDVTEVEGVKIGDVATIIGREGDVEITAADVGAFGMTSCYEATTRINSNIKRILV